MKLKFQSKDFDALKKTCAALERQLFTDGYFGTDCLVLKFDYSDEFKQLLRPYPNFENLEFALGLVKCQDCDRKNLMVFCEKTNWLCQTCFNNRAKIGNKLTYKRP